MEGSGAPDQVRGGGIAGFGLGRRRTS